METKSEDAESTAQAPVKEVSMESHSIPTPTTKSEEKAQESAQVKLEEPMPENVPDPDEDDLDDLDDMLDEFSPAQPAAKTASQLSQSSGPGGPQPAPEEYIPNEGISADDDFTKHLQAGMADLLGQLENSPEIQAQFESMLKGFGGDEILEEAASRLPKLASSSNPTASKSIPSKPSAAATAAAEKKFQETIKKTMERMQSSGDQATAAAVSENTDDIIAEMMKAMQASGLDGEGGEEDFSKMLLGMMEQLTNKEILYEPMKELDDKFPEWMKKNQGKVKEDDMKRYKEQQVYVREIMQRFERKGYSDDNVVDREYIVERMQKMQAAGSPPPDLVGDMAAAQEAFGAPEEGCPQQ